MKRTPLWVWLSAVGVQFAALALCIWAMERNLPSETQAPVPVEPEPERPSQPAHGSHTSALGAAQDAPFFREPPPPPYEPVPEPVREPEPPPRPRAEARPEPPPWEAPIPEPPPPWRAPAPDPAPVPRFAAPPRPAEPVSKARIDPEPEPPRRVTIRAVQPSSTSGPRFGPPPERPREPPPEPASVPRFITELADATSQVVGGKLGDGRFAFGFYPDGNIRFVDVDGGRYAGKAESARARMREVDGMRAFTVQIGVGEDRRLQASFTGGAHEGETIALEPLVGWTVA